MMVFLRIILVAFLIYFALKLIGRLIFPWLYTQNTSNKEYTKGGNNTRTGKEGDVTIQDLKNEKNKVIERDEGEYIDYEEVK